MKFGEKCLERRSAYPCAFEAFSIVINRYYQDSPSMPTEVKDAVAALHYIGTLYLVAYFKYDKAYKYLSLSLQLAEDNNINQWLPYTYINLANLWEINKMTFPDASSSGFKYIADAWDAAKSTVNGDLLPIIAFDMAILTYTNAWNPVFSRQMREFLSFQSHGSSVNESVAEYFVRGVERWSEQNYEEAEKYLLLSLKSASGKECQEMMPGGYNEDARYGIRQVLSILSALVEFYIAVNRYEEANEMLMAYEARADGHPDFKIDLYKQYMDYFSALNFTDSVSKYHYLYLKGKESISNDNKLYEVGENLFLDRIERINEEVISLSGKNRRQRQQLWGAVLALGLLVSLIAVALWAYVRLRNKSAQLFRKNVEMIEEQRHFSLRHSQLQDELERLQGILKGGKSLGGSYGEECVPECRAEDEGHADVGTVRTMQRNIMEDAEAERLYSRILAVMEAEEEVYRPDFSLERLSALAGLRPRVVSQVVKRVYGSNFSQLLNEYRIREACLRFQNTAEYGNYTVEAIAESVGYRSRTGFSSLFKKATGLSPSEYHRQAKRAANMQ